MTNDVVGGRVTFVGFEMMSTDIEGPWKVFKYEAEMFFNLSALLADGHPEYAALSLWVKNSIVESALLHSRQLADILLSRGKGADDIKLDELLPGFKPTKLDELADFYGNNKLVSSPCWSLNKRLAHLTTNRTYSHDYSHFLMAMLPLLQEITLEVLAKREEEGLPPL